MIDVFTELLIVSVYYFSSPPVCFRGENSSHLVLNSCHIDHFCVKKVYPQILKKNYNISAVLCTVFNNNTILNFFRSQRFLQNWQMSTTSALATALHLIYRLQRLRLWLSIQIFYATVIKVPNWTPNKLRIHQ